MDHPNDDLTARDALLQELLERQAQLTDALDRQVQLTEALARRVEELEGGAASAVAVPAAPPGSRPVRHPVGEAAGEGGTEGDTVDEVDEADERTSRRQLLTRAATAAAGAVAGGTALAVAQATPAAAVTTYYTGNPGIDVTASPDSAGSIAIEAHGLTSSTGIRTISQGGTGIFAATNNGFAVDAETTGGYAVYGTTIGSGVAVTGQAGAAGGTQLWLNGNPPPPATSAQFRPTGSVVKDAFNDVWFCVIGGTPGTWLRVTGPNTAGALTLLSAPKRVYDSRPGNNPATPPKTPLANGATRDVDCTLNGSGVPVGATGVLANFTVVNTSGAGFLAAFKKGVAVPNASTINWFQAGTVVANTTVVACDATGKISCYVPPSSSADFFVDIIGYYR